MAFLKRPRGWRDAGNGCCACPHRDTTVCPECAATNAAHCVDTGGGVFFWYALSQDAASLREMVGSGLTKSDTYAARQMPTEESPKLRAIKDRVAARRGGGA